MADIQLILGDCLEGLKKYPDGKFDLAIIDPPYGTKFHNKGGGYFSNEKQSIGLAKKKHYQDMLAKGWDIQPTDEFFAELFRVSKNQIIWGGHFFSLPTSPHWLVWDKKVTHSKGFFGDGELAWTSFTMREMIRIIRYRWNGMIKEPGNPERIHPTEKPVGLYKYLLSEYAQPGDLILDTHFGSASSALAAYELGFDYVGYEINEKVYNKALSRYRALTSQLKLTY